MYYRIHEKLVQQNVIVLSTFQKCCSVTFLRALWVCHISVNVNGNVIMLVEMAMVMLVVQCSQ
jgi:hypothetical protein